MQRIKWTKNDVVSRRGNFRPVIAKFDNSRYWLTSSAVCSVFDAIEQFRAIGKVFGSKSVEIKYLFDAGDRLTEKEDNILEAMWINSPTDYIFRREISRKEGEERKFLYYQEDEVFPSNIDC